MFFKEIIYEFLIQNTEKNHFRGIVRIRNQNPKLWIEIATLAIFQNLKIINKQTHPQQFILFSCFSSEIPIFFLLWL